MRALSLKQQQALVILIALIQITILLDGRVTQSVLVTQKNQDHHLLLLFIGDVSSNSGRWSWIVHAHYLYI